MSNISENAEASSKALNINLTDFIAEFGEELMDSINCSNPPVYGGTRNQARADVMSALKRTPFHAQAQVVQAVAALMLDRKEQAAVINAEMGTGKTMMAIATAAVMHVEGYKRSLVISPPHLVYKWRREILETVENARVWVLNGPDTLAKLLKLRQDIGMPQDGRQEFFILGRVRMRMDFHWKLSCWPKRGANGVKYAACSDCGYLVKDQEGSSVAVDIFLREERRRKCDHCGSPLWTLIQLRQLDRQACAQGFSQARA